jgi:hypothetical protein
VVPSVRTRPLIRLIGQLATLTAIAALVTSLAKGPESLVPNGWWPWRNRDQTNNPEATVPRDRTPPESRGAEDDFDEDADQRNTEPDAAQPVGNKSRLRMVAASVLTILALLLVWFALVAPNQLSHVTLGAFVRIPIEGLVLVALAIVLPAKARRIVAALVGAILAALTIVKILDMGFYEALDRPFNPVTDKGYFGSAVGVLSDTIGHSAAIVTVVAAIVLAVALLILMPLAVMRLTRFAADHPTTSIRATAALAAAWALFAVLGAEIVDGSPIASTSASGYAYDEVRRVRDTIQEQRAFAEAVADDRFRDTPGSELLTSLRGKDVIIAFVESYGRVAVEDPAISPGVDAVLDAGTDRLRAAGFDSRSAFLTSPTFGGISWLAHSTLQSGVWVDNQLLYDNLVDTGRFTLSDAFKRAGWRTVGDVPANREEWPEGTSFYHYDQLYDEDNVGYAGPKFGYASMPDQYTLAAFQRLELAASDRPPIMAEIDLVSSHNPWAPLPHLIDWGDVGDGSVFDGMPEEGDSADEVWRDPDKVRAAYGQSIEYSLSALISFIETYGDDNLVLVVLGDHQPATIVSGEGASRDVPITIIAHDPAVLDRISGWGWQEGMHPDPAAPVWPMDSFRDQFLTAYGPKP